MLQHKERYVHTFNNKPSSKNIAIFSFVKLDCTLCYNFLILPQLHKHTHIPKPRKYAHAMAPFA